MPVLSEPEGQSTFVDGVAIEAPAGSFVIDGPIVVVVDAPL